MLQSDTIRFLWDKLLFAQYLELTVDLSREVCLDRLMGLAQPLKGTLIPASITTWRGGMNPDAYELQICADRYGRRVYTNAQFVGMILKESRMEKTVIRGKLIIVINLVAVAIWTFLLIIAFLIEPRFSLIILAIGLLYALDIRSDYRKLRSLIEQALQPS